MMVPAKRKYIEPGRIETMKVGETLHINSGLGGAFQVKYTGQKNGVANFKSTHKDWPGEYQYPVKEAHKPLFDLVPDYDSPAWVNG